MSTQDKSKAEQLLIELEKELEDITKRLNAVKYSLKKNFNSKLKKFDK